jgi:hypothetical protein
VVPGDYLAALIFLFALILLDRVRHWLI